jgi:CrcB protein
LQKIFWISLGAAAGANLRYWVAQQIAKFSQAFPYGTLFINLTGSFALGFFMIWTSERVLADPRWRLLVAVGFCGGYTTYSSYAYETLALFEQGEWLAASMNMLGTSALCLAGVVAGAVLARSL